MCYHVWNSLILIYGIFQLPDKSIAALVKYYYSWKKTRSRTSLMDRQAKKFAVKGDGDKM